MTIIAFLSAFAGFAAMALSMHKHYRDLFGVAPPERLRKALRTSGFVKIAASLGLAIAVEGISIGLVLWAGLLTLAAIAVCLLLTYRERWWHR